MQSSDLGLSPSDPCSWDLGPAHIISFSTEVYFFLHYGRHLVERQFRWLEKDLQVGPGVSPALPSPPVAALTLVSFSRKPIGIGRPDPGSSRWVIGPCTAPTPTWMTARGTKAG